MLLLSISPLPNLRPSDVTIRLSALVAPYLKQASGYIRPEFRALVTRDRNHILAIAKRFNARPDTNMSDEQFATVMVTILYNEHNGWLEDAFPAVRPLTPIYQDAQAISNAYAGTNFSVWPSNIRPSVVREILNHEVPAVGIVPLAIELPSDTNSHQNAQSLANTPDAAYELLGANLRRGVYRAQKEDVVVTWQTLLAWHNAGIVDPKVIAKNASLQHYLSRAVPYIASAQGLYRAVSMCQNNNNPDTTNGHEARTNRDRK